MFQSKSVRAGMPIVLGLFVSCLSARPSEFSLHLRGGVGWLHGGDLNRSIGGWRDYYQDRKSSSFSSSFGLKELRGIFEVQAELEVRLSPRWRVGLAVGYVSGKTSGDVSTSLSEQQGYMLPSGGDGAISLEEETIRLVGYELRAVPVLVTVYRSFRLRENVELSLGTGGGFYFGRYNYHEGYVYDLDYSDTQSTAIGTIQYIDRYESAGEYTETATARGFGLHGLVGLEYRISPSLGLTFEVAGRWAGLDDWRGEKADAYQWSQIWGFEGGFAEDGQVEESAEGRLWLVDARGGATPGTYSRLVFGAEEPASSSYSNVRPAQISLGGISARIGFRFQFGERR
jgi:hypothetical protein